MTAANGTGSANRSHRGEVVVNDVLVAAREELARVGYRALRIEDVATRANVNRTTIYRRWPSKIDLVRATLHMMLEQVATEIPDTGTLRGDLLVVAGDMLRFLVSPNGHVLIRMAMAEGTEPELRALSHELRSEKENRIAQIIERARQRGEIRANLPTEVLHVTLLGGISHRIFALCTEPHVVSLEEHVDLLLSGALVR